MESLTLLTITARLSNLDVCVVPGYASVTQTAQKMKEVFIKEFFSKSDQIRRKLRIKSHLLNKSLMENFIFL